MVSRRKKKKRNAGVLLVSAFYSELEEGEVSWRSTTSPDVTCCMADAKMDESTSPRSCEVTMGAAVTFRPSPVSHMVVRDWFMSNTWRMCCCVPFGPSARTGVTANPPTFIPPVAVPAVDVVDTKAPSSPPLESDFGRDDIKGPKTWSITMSKYRD